MAKELTGRRRSFYIQWDSTNNCNLRCSHCYHNSEGEDHRNHKQCSDLMSFSEVKSMLGDLEQTTERWGFNPVFTISGGEPLLRKDLFQILDYTHSKNIRTNILTNGTLITPEKARRIKDSNVSIVQISLDGDREKHNEVRGKSYAYDKAMEGIGNCRYQGIHVTISSTLMKSNLSQIEQIVQNSISAGAKGIGFQTFVPNPLLGVEDPEFLNCSDMKEVYDSLAELRELYAGKIDIYQSEVLWHLYKSNLEGDSAYQGGCSAGFTGISVLSNGTVYACRRLPIPLGKINEGIIKLVTESPLMEGLRKNRRNQTKSCDTAQHCGGCRAIAYATTGNPFSKDPTCFKHLK